MQAATLLFFPSFAGLDKGNVRSFYSCSNVKQMILKQRGCLWIVAPSDATPSATAGIRTSLSSAAVEGRSLCHNCFRRRRLLNTLNHKVNLCAFFCGQRDPKCVCVYASVCVCCGWFISLWFQLYVSVRCVLLCDWNRMRFELKQPAL